jgi:hypothetical protein
MNARWISPRCRSALVAGGLALILPLSGTAVDSVPPEALNVKVFPDRYVIAGRPFPDLAALEAWAKPILIRTLWLDSCGAASTRQLLAAVERFHSIYPEGILIRTLPRGEAECLSAAEHASGGQPNMSLSRPDAEYYATDQLGRSALP